MNRFFTLLSKASQPLKTSRRAKVKPKRGDCSETKTHSDKSANTLAKQIPSKEFIKEYQMYNDDGAEMTALQTLIQALREARERASCGPWNDGYTNAGKITKIDDHIWGGPSGKEPIAKFIDEKDIPFICLAANELPKLLKALEVYDKCLRHLAGDDDSQYEQTVCGAALAEVARICGDETPEGNL